MISYPVAIALVVLAGCLATSGVALLRVRRAHAAAGLLIAGGLGLILACALDAGGRTGAVAPTLSAVGLLVVPLAVVVYPRASWRTPVDLVAVLVVGAAGTVGTLAAERKPVVETMGLMVVLTAVALLWWRLEHATPRDRTALTWLALGLGGSVITAGLVAFAAPNVWGGVVSLALLCVVGPCMYLGVVHPEVVDVRGLVVHVVVFITAAVAYLAAFAGVAAFLEILGGQRPSAGLLGISGALLATLFQPTRVVLRGVIDELLFGSRPDPLGAAGAVAGHLGDDPGVALRTIRNALVLPYAALYTDGQMLAESGSKTTYTKVLTLALPDRTPVGELVVGLRPGDLGLGPGDEHVLALVTPLLAQTLRARALARDLQLSREDAITAIEEERRRLRRDLHDGMGPLLSGIAFMSDAALNSVRQDPAVAEDLLRQLRTETVGAIAEIRDLVYAMRPPALDELGLIRAIEQQAGALHTPTGRRLEVSVLADSLPSLPAATEVATYRIVVEALINVARHSGSTTAAVTIRHCSAGLSIEVCDDGGRRTPWKAGVGIASMRERAAALGGTLDARSTSRGGVVTATLPARTVRATRSSLGLGSRTHE
ncbi:histidine kinase [Nocardioides sp.]|uniref:sensor histidine kinase n=1 Tax=Nocardioides sp. TaxID=35761 RepID=UPI00260190A1|nr:histidine kinase [Nocardioides sp.]MCW2738008.1 hypothetical protein [Nocardioides sp.]